MPIIVSGCPRSGTSLTMLLISKIIGSHRIQGSKWPQEPSPAAQGADETDKKYRLRTYIQENSGNKRDDSYKDLNPNGFWECRYSVRGIAYNYQDKDKLQGYLEEEKGKETCMKIVSQGLLPSDPRYINKIIYVIRHPRNVAKSQERLKRGFDVVLANGETQNITEGLVIHTPDMYMRVTGQAARFFGDNPHIPVHFVLYDDLVAEPETSIKAICEFMGEDAERGWDRCKGVVNPKLKRSYPEDVPSNLWEEAEEIYTRFAAKDFIGVEHFLSNPKLNLYRDSIEFICARSGGVATASICRQCMTSSVVRENFKAAAALPGRQIDWKNKPCLWECALDPDRTDDEYVDVFDSIKDNHWK